MTAMDSTDATDKTTKTHRGTQRKHWATGGCKTHRGEHKKHLATGGYKTETDMIGTTQGDTNEDDDEDHARRPHTH